MGRGRWLSLTNPLRDLLLGGKQVLYPPQGSPLKVVEADHQLVNEDAEQSEGRNLIPTSQGEEVQTEDLLDLTDQGLNRDAPQAVDGLSGWGLVEVG